MPTERNLLDLSQPFCTRRQKLTLLSKTVDGLGLVFERPDSAGVFKTDLYGYISDKEEASAPLVYNGYPEQFHSGRYRAQYSIDDLVFYIRGAAKERKVLVGKVERIEKGGLVLSLFDTHGLKLSKSRQQGDGTTLVPFGFVFKTPESVNEYLNSFSLDCERAMTTYRDLMVERMPVGKASPFKVRKRNSVKDDHRAII